MVKFVSTFVAELLKIRRSKVFIASILFFAFVPLMMGLMFFVQKHPEIAAKLGMIGTKATLLRLGKADWMAYLGFLIQGMAGVGLIGFGFIISWIFGREYVDRTLKDIVALPVSRTSIVVSKFLVVTLWSVLLMLVFWLSGFLFGKLIDISGWDVFSFSQITGVYLITSFLTILLCTPVAFFAGTSRGYLFPMSFVILTMLMANFTGLVGLGPYFPWAIPGLFSVPAGTEGMQLTITSYLILISTSGLGFFGTIFWWLFADQK